MVKDDKIKITDSLKVDADNIESARSFDSKLQGLGRMIINSLLMLVKNVKLYGPDNEIFVKPFEKLQECINTIIASEGQLSLQSAGESFYLNNMLLKFDLKAIESLGYLHQEFERCGVGGFLLEKAVTVSELQNFIYIFSSANQEVPGEQGVSTHKLTALKLRRYEKLKEILEKQEDQSEVALEDSHLDRKRYGLVIYGRLVHFMRKYLAGLRGEGPEIAISGVTPLLQDLVDISFEKSSHFLGLATSVGAGDGYLAVHSASVALLSTVFGVELGLNKEQLRELATAAMFHDIGRAHIDETLLAKKEKLTPYETLQFARAPMLAALTLLSSAQLNHMTINNMIVAHDHQIEYGKPLKDLGGDVTLIEKTADLSVYTKITAIADCYETLTSVRAYSPSIAFTLMNGDLKHRFDPLYLRIFGRLLKGLSQRVLSESGQKVELF